MKRKIGLTLVLTAAFWAVLSISKLVHDSGPFWLWCTTNVVICSLYLALVLFLGKRVDKAEARQLVASATAPAQEMPGPNDEYCWMHEGPKMGGWYCEHPECKNK